MNRFYVVIDEDDDRNLVYKPTEYTMALEAFAEKGAFPLWRFQHGDNEITVYAGALSAVPAGEDREEMEQRILGALGLIQRNYTMELQLIVTDSAKVEEFHDAIGINVVIPATGMAICGIFVWGQHNVDLRIYETSLLRVNTKLYIEVIQTAADLADLLYKNDVRTMHDVKLVLQTASKTFERVKLQVD